MLRIGLYQFAPRFGRVAENLARVLAAIDRAEADLLVLPELALTGYLFRDRAELCALAEEPRRSASVAALVDSCRRNRCFILTGFAEKCGPRVYNSALLVGGRGVVATYRKLHLFNEEKRYFDPGNLPLTVQRVAGVRLGIMICFDWAFPEASRTLALAGAEVLCLPANLVLPFAQAAMVTRAIENGVYTVIVNRIGEERRPQGRVRFTGGSQVVAPTGALLCRAPVRRAALRVVTLDPRRADDKRITARNDLFADRRPEHYRLG
jgi:predicted amidohydrolase